MDEIKKAEQPEESTESATPALTESELESTVGGATSLQLACCNGKHIAKGTITI
jgi:hypothetical protein